MRIQYKNVYKSRNHLKLKMEKKSNWFSVLLILVILIALIMLILQNTLFKSSLSIIEVPASGFGITGHATSASTISNVTIEKYLSLALCTNLSAGIIFGNVSALPATNINASHNYDGTSSGSTMCVNISDDGNTNVDLCTKANAALASLALDVIALGNETYSNSTVTNSTHPILGDDVALTTSYVKSGNAISVGNVNYYRFWLDIPVAQPSGDYNNTVYFKGVTTTLVCGS